MNQVFIGPLDLSAYPFELHNSELSVSIIFEAAPDGLVDTIRRGLIARTIFIRNRKHTIARQFRSSYLDANYLQDKRFFRFRLWGFGKGIYIHVRKAKEPK